MATLVALSATPAAAQTPALRNNSPIAALQRWAAEIDAHVPGEVDAAVLAHASLKPAERSLLISMTGPFTFYLRRVNEIAGPPNVHLSPLEKTLVTALARKILASQTFSEWLHRAVMLETDVAVLAPELTAEAMRDARGDDVGEAIHSDDGELGARELLDWHWRLARDLVDLRDPAASDAFAASWYHAVALYQLDRSLLGELEPHLRKGLQLFPADARIQFDEACLADAYGSARVQAILIGTPPRGFRPSVPNAETAWTQASRQFARVLELDPNFVEARVRLARLQLQDGKAADALALLATAFRLPMKPELEYMAHLVAGRASGALSRPDDAAEHFKAALKLFPSAQTPVIALSHLALASGEIDSAATVAASLSDMNPADRDDPWWSYFQATWLGQRGLLDQLRDGVRR